ncbi:18050_t:CDS:2 [Dentiscutata erythropus]|uniref:18050_t:CDS:1 n=1 Tax=Dentiscutata erythropus TaxID=1348616 RepID=A0A9N9J9R5_9GLOM|nr:18050_t:CDS:2 [Dentiscutata erythropus]
MPKQKINNGSCVVKNCDKDPNPGQQLCNPHYMIIVENKSTHENDPMIIVEDEPINKDKPISNLSNKLALGD